MIKDFIIQQRSRINLVLGLFAAGMTIGALASFVYPEGFEKIVGAFADKFGADPALDQNLALAIFLQNLQASVIAWIGGLAVGLIPAFIVLANGVILGYVITFVALNVNKLSSAALYLAGGLLPHAIFELPAFLMAAVLGLMLGLNWLSPAAKGRRWAVLKENALVTAKYFSFVVLGLAIAALVEVFISGKIVNNF
jgi:stage II sporulation protein M